MNGTTRDIIAKFAVNVDDALAIQRIVDENGLDYSECTKREYATALNEAFAEWSKQVAA